MSKLDRTDGTTLTLGALGLLAAIGALRKTGSGAKSFGHEVAFSAIRVGDRVTILTPHGHERIGSAVMKGPHGWVLNMGGRHGTPAVATADNIVRVRKKSVRRGGKRVGAKNKVQWIGHGEIYISAPETDQVQFAADRIEENFFSEDSEVRVSISFDDPPHRQQEEDGSRHWWTGHGEIYIIAPDKDLIPLTVQTIEGLAPENVAVDVAIEQIEAEDQ